MLAVQNRKIWVKAGIGAGVVVVFVGTYWLLSESGVFPIESDWGALQDRILQIGHWGPLMVIGLMAVAIVLSPLPSAPIALAAGATYGHTWGTVYVLIGSEIGALIAFSIARMLGFEVLRRWLGDRLSLGFAGSQNDLMAFVLVSRLLPFISFDVVSYAAGLTPLTIWRFAAATLAGVLPASFLLAHFGDELASTEMERIAGAVLLLGAVFVIPLAVKAVRAKRHATPESRNRETR